MICVFSTTRRFGPLIDYLLKGASRQDIGRVSWTAYHNLPFDDPALASTIMRATARENTRVEQPIAHLSVSFDPADPVSEHLMRGVALQLLADLHMHELQTMIVAHGDRIHPHMHLVVNRVHPETGRAWHEMFRKTLQRSLRVQERALGLRENVGSLYRLPDQEQPAATTVQGRRELTHPPLAYSRAPLRTPTVADAANRVQQVAIDRHIRDRYYWAESVISTERARLSGPQSADEITRSQTRLAAAERELNRVESARLSRPAPLTTAHAAYLALRELAPAELPQLGRWLTPSQLTLAESIRTSTRLALDLERSLKLER
jgi:hypothetical protein